jgi:hypothetical protein
VIDELMGHQAGRRGEREGSMIGTRYRHMTEAMQARVIAVIAERLAVALAVMLQVWPKPGSGEEAACWVAVAILVVVAALGFTMVTRWRQDRAAAATGRSNAARPPEQHSPVAVVCLHDLLTVAT